MTCNIEGSFSTRHLFPNGLHFFTDIKVAIICAIHSSCLVEIPFYLSWRSIIILVNSLALFVATGL